jgi:hypothetical protein
MAARAVAITLSALLGLGVPGGASAQRAAPTLDAYLRSIGLDASQRTAAARGRAIARLLPTRDNRDVTVFGIVGVDVPRQAVVARAVSGERFFGGGGSRVHQFGNPPSPADVRDLAFDESEYRGLRNCRSGDCDFKLTASAMQAFAGQVDWSSRSAKAQADERLRADVLALVTDYARRGNPAMPVYEDGRGVRSEDSFAALVAQTSDLYRYAPELHRYLSAYPAERPDGARDFLYWSEDRLPHLRPTLTVSHAVVYTPPGSATDVSFVARKQLYATHYFEAALELLAIVDGGGGPGEPRTYLMTVRRFRFDALPGGLFNIRGRVRRQLVDATRDDLERQRAALQRDSSSDR